MQKDPRKKEIATINIVTPTASLPAYMHSLHKSLLYAYITMQSAVSTPFLIELFSLVQIEISNYLPLLLPSYTKFVALLCWHLVYYAIAHVVKKKY
jgi:hypothetical protein